MWRGSHVGVDDSGHASSNLIYDTLAEGYDTAAPDHTARLRRDLAARVARGGKFLDVGCGTASHLLATAADTALAVGVDLNAAMLRRGRRRGEEAAGPVALIQGSVLDLPFADGSFDAAASFATLVLVPDVDRAVKELARVSRPGALLALDISGRHSLATRYWSRWYAHQGHAHFNTVSLPGLHRLLGRHGFDCLEVHPLGATDHWKYVPRLHRSLILERFFHGEPDRDAAWSRRPVLRWLATRWIVLARRRRT